jgi:hypothetical protein
MVLLQILLYVIALFALILGVGAGTPMGMLLGFVLSFGIIGLLNKYSY